MIAIDTEIRCFDGLEIEANKNWQKIFLASGQPDLVKFFQDCLDQDLIINMVHHIESASLVYDFDKHAVIRYYSVDQPRAEIFTQKLEDMTADFSLKKFWFENKFHFFTSITAVDFETQIPEYTVVNSALGEVWSTSFPAPWDIAYPASMEILV